MENNLAKVLVSIDCLLFYLEFLISVSKLSICLIMHKFHFIWNTFRFLFLWYNLSAWNTTKAFHANGFLGNYHDHWQNSLHFDRKPIPIVLNDYIIKIAECLAQSLTQLTRNEEYRRRDEDIVGQHYQCNSKFCAMWLKCSI